MDDTRLDAVLHAIACERHAPSEKLVKRTRAMIRGRRLFQVVVFLSLCAQLMTVGVVVALLTLPDVQPMAKVFGVVGLVALMGCMILVAVAARGRVIWFFKQAKMVTG